MASSFSLSTLRGGNDISGEASILVTAWGENEGDSLFIGEATREGDVWRLNEEYEVKKTLFFSFIYPSTLLRHKESVLIMESDQVPVYYYGTDVSPEDHELTLSMKLVQAKISLIFDLSSFPTDAVVEELRVRSRYTYGWLNMQKGTFSRMDIPFDETTLYRYEVNKSVGTLIDTNGLFKHTYLLMPQKDTEMTVWLRIDGRDHIAFISFGEVQSNKEYLYKVGMLNRYGATTLTEEEKRRGQSDPKPNIKEIFFTDYEYTCTSEYMMDLNNKQGVVLGFWMDSRIESTKKLQYKLLILDEAGNVVSQSPTYGGLEIRGYHYDGFSIPFYLDVPAPGRYRYKLLIREEGQRDWYEPNQKSDDTPEDIYFRVHEGQTVFATSMRLDSTGSQASVSGVSSRKYDTRYMAQYSLNNYSSSDQEVTIRLYNRRQPFEGHTNIDLENRETWEDFIGSSTAVVPAMSASFIDVDYVISKRRPTVNRFSPYICATIEYNHNGKEYPLLADGDLLYKISSHLYSPGITISNSGIVNKAYVDVK